MRCAPHRFHYTLMVLALLAMAPAAGSITHTYDDLDRLVQASYDNGTIISYTYDAAGNRLSQVVSVDPDGDGIPYIAGATPCTGGQTSACEGNCPNTANSNQADLDAGAVGNLCDEDDDGDALFDVYETNTGLYVPPTDAGTDPLNSDTDGDGVGDGGEVIAGTDPNQPNQSSSIPVPLFGGVGHGLLDLGLLAAGRRSLHLRQRSVS